MKIKISELNELIREAMQATMKESGQTWDIADTLFKGPPDQVGTAMNSMWPNQKIAIFHALVQMSDEDRDTALDNAPKLLSDKDFIQGLNSRLIKLHGYGLPSLSKSPRSGNVEHFPERGSSDSQLSKHGALRPSKINGPTEAVVNKITETIMRKLSAIIKK